MNVEKIVVDAVNAQIKINLAKADYQEAVEKTLKDYRRRANVPGFRPGMVPMGIVKKMYGKAVLADEVNKKLSDTLYNYIKDNHLNILGEPLPADTQQPQDLEAQDEIEFLFDIALAPELEYTLNKRDAVPYYTIDVTDEMVENQIKSLASRGGHYEKVENYQDGDTLKGTMTEICEGDDAIKVEDALILPSYFKNEDEKAKIQGAKLGDIITYNPYNSWDGSEVELASLLRLPKEKAKEITSDFHFEVKEISRFVEGELNQELFDQIYGENNVVGEEAFRARVRQDIADQFIPESEYRFMVDAEKCLVKKFKDVQFPEAFLKRWLLATDSKKTAESIDAEMPQMIEELKWHLMKEDIVKKNNLEIKEEDVLAVARKVTKAQFAQYGMGNIPDELLDNYSKEMLKKPETVRNLQDQAMSAKVAEYLKGVVKINEKQVSMEEFNKLFEK